MIPILFSADATSFNNNGLGALADCTSCKVTEKRNGEYILTMQYPLDGIHFKDIQKSCIIWVKPSDGANNQAFRIYKTKKPINGIVTIEAEHISYQLSMIPTMPFTAESASAALQGLKTNAAEPCPFFFYTDKQTIATYTQEQPASIRSRLGGVSGSILDVYGGEYEFDNYDVHLWANRGSDKGVTIRYGKNLIDLKQEENIQNVVTGVVPFFANEDTLVTLPEKVVESEYVDLYPYPRTVILDLSSEWTDEVPTVEQLRQRAQKYIEDNDIGIPKVSIDVSFIALWQTEEYKDIAPLERVNLCDTVTIIFEKLGIEAKAKVISTEYDVLRERYTKIEVGDAKSTLATTIVNIDSTTNTKIQTATSFLQKAIIHATDMITGGLGGYVYLKPNANGYPEEILIMDSPDIETAVNIWRWNKNGLGFSSNGYAGPYGTAITSDGQIVADYITAGTLNGDLIQAGTVNTSALSVEAQEDLQAIHNYIPYDILENRARWEINAKDIQLVTASVGQQDFDHCLRMDGSDISVYNPNYQCQFKTDFAGKPTIVIEFDWFIWDTITIPTQQFFYIWFYNKDRSSYWTTYFNIDGGTYNSGEVYHVRWEYTFSDTCDIETYVPRFGFRFLPGTVTYIANLSITGTTGNYNKAVVTTTATGLNTMVRSGNVISAINQSAESVSISANKINLTGDLSLRGDFTSYNSDDNTDYCFIDSGDISFFQNGVNVFTISSQAILGQYAGIFFGDVEDPSSMADYTYIEQNLVSTPLVYCKANGEFQGETGYTLICEQAARFKSITVDDIYVTGNQQLGSSFRGTVSFYSSVFNAGGGTEFISDRRKKRNIVDLAVKKARSFIMALKPVKYKFTKDISSSNRYHHGFIAQDVKKAMPEDWGIYCENKELDRIGLRYDEFIADMIAVIQDHEKRIQKLEDELKRSKK
jgi:phage minor structural protein